MRILHTADWHIGQTLSGFGREAEHRGFLEQLGQLIETHEVDALLVAGDVFDGINPSAEAQRLLYAALAGFVRRRRGLTVVMIAGNHDAAARLEAPGAMLAELGVHLRGTLKTDDPLHHLIALPDASGRVCAHVLAIPFLRAADLPGLTLEAQTGGEGAVVGAVRALHANMTAAAVKAAGGLPLIAMGHLTCSGAEESKGAERPIRIGGEDAVPPDVYPAALSYVALGHLHKPQSLDGGRLRYSGSPFPLSATEIPYDHGVTLIDLDGATLTHRHIPLPRLVANLRLPAGGAMALADLPAALAALALDAACPSDLRPFVTLCLTADRPATQLKTEAEVLLDKHPLRLAGLTIDRPATTTTAPEAPPPSLSDTTPEALFAQAFHEAHGFAPQSPHLAAFRDALAEV